MSLIDKVKALFEAQTPVAMAETIFVKTQDGKIFLVKSPQLALEAEIVMVDEAGVEQPIENGDYILEDLSTISVMGGKIAEIATAEEETTEEEVPVEAVEEKKEEDVQLEAIPAGDYTLDNGDVITIDENQVVINWIKAEVAVEEAPAEEMEVVSVDLSALKAKVKELELAIEAKDNEVKVAKEAFDKLKSEPAVKPINVKKFEKEVTPSKNNKGNDMLNKVISITNKK